jgi:hypothetical protein
MTILINPHNIKLVSLQKMWAGSSAWLERSTDNRKVASSNPARPTISIFSRRIFAKSFTERKIFY